MIAGMLLLRATAICLRDVALLMGWLRRYMLLKVTSHADIAYAPCRLRAARFSRCYGAIDTPPC